MPLPRPIGNQSTVLALDPRLHTLVLGSAGSGKTVLALLRAALLADSATPNNGRTLLVTFTQALATYLRSIGAAELANVEIENYHKFARGYLNSRGKMGRNVILDPDPRLVLIEQAIKTILKSAPNRNIVAELAEEIAWIDRHELTRLERYERDPRVGRSPLDVSTRKTVFLIYQEYKRQMRATGMMCDWEDMASIVCEEMSGDVSPRRYRHIVVDEGQDFSPAMLRSLYLATPHAAGGTITVVGDSAQQLFGHKINWKQAGIPFSTPPWVLRDNYRNTGEIVRLAQGVTALPHFTSAVEDLIAPVMPAAKGPPPVLVRCQSRAAELSFLRRQIEARVPTHNTAVLLRLRSDEDAIATFLPKDAIRLHKRMIGWHTSGRLYYGAFHAAKGLEFDTVIVPFLDNEKLPDPDVVADFGVASAMERESKLLYVAITRAKQRLIMTTSSQTVTKLLPPEASKLYTVLHEP